MSYQLSTLVSRVQQRLRDTNYSSSEITDYLNDTINDIYNEYRLPFMQTTQDYTVTANVADITNGTGLPTDFDQAVDIIDRTNGQEQLIPYRDIREVDQWYTDANDTSLHPAGKPEFWYFYGQTPYLFPTPADAYTLTLRYYKKPTELAQDTDVPSIPSNFTELLVVGATFRAMQVRDDYDEAVVFENKYEELLQKLVVKASQRQVGRPTVMRINRYHLPKTSSWKGRM